MTEIHAQPRKRRVAELKPQESNPRTLNPAAFAGLVDSVKQYGFEDGATCAIQPVIVNRHPDFLDQIVGGEMRWRATREAGIEEIWTREVFYDAEQLRELTIRLNVPAGDWDWEKLAEQAEGEQLLFFGFKDLEFPSLPADDDLQLEGSDKTVADAKKAARAGSGQAPEMESLTRQYQIFLVGEEYDELQAMIQVFRAHYDKKIATEAVMAALRDQAARICGAEERQQQQAPVAEEPAASEAATA